ncbi:MAG: LysE family translocator [Chloroflexota bacterium]
MPDATSLTIYLTAALVLAITPGPGIFYVLTRSLKGGRGEGYASAFGTTIGGIFHVMAAALGLSAVLATSAVAFSIVKYAGAAYLVFLGLRTIFASDDLEIDEEKPSSTPNGALRQGIVTEMLNPKTALFFLAFIPQFIDPTGSVFTQFLVLGMISVTMNTSADLVVATLAGPIGGALKRQAGLRRGQRLFSGSGLIALGAYVAVTGNGETT